LLIQATEWATREQVFHSYELLARYVMPHFQGSLVNLKSSQEWSIEQRDYLQSLRRASLQRARDDYKGG
jgi:limonene 1,2-monooxygenase